ncbi:WecB/TagA/CpsF family glycosyltransferase [Sphingomonas sp. RS2018]
MSVSIGEIDFLDVHFADVGLVETLAWVRRAMAGNRFAYLVTPNVDHLVRLHGEGMRGAFADAVADADLRVNDSRILAKLASLSGLTLPVVPGSDLTRLLIEGGLPAGTRVLLVGGSAVDAAWLAEQLAGAEVTHHQPPMGVARDPAKQRAIVEQVEASDAALVLFAIGAPQSEIVAHQLQRRGRARGVGLCIGASIEFLTGAKRRAPIALQRIGMEWAYRLASEPRRLWRRYLVEGPRIFAIWHRWRNR